MSSMRFDLPALLRLSVAVEEVLFSATIKFIPLVNDAVLKRGTGLQR